MFSFGKRKGSRLAGSAQCHVILLAGDEAQLKELLLEYLSSEGDFERTAVSLDNNSRGAMVVTFDDPTALKKGYVAKGLELFTITVRPSRDNPHLIATDLRLSGEYERLRKTYFP